MEGIGIDELYKRIDPFDVSYVMPSCWRLSLKVILVLIIMTACLNRCSQYPEREAVFDCWPMWFHKVRVDCTCLRQHRLTMT